MKSVRVGEWVKLISFEVLDILFADSTLLNLAENC